MDSNYLCGWSDDKDGGNYNGDDDSDNGDDDSDNGDDGGDWGGRPSVMMRFRWMAGLCEQAATHYVPASLKLNLT